MTQKELNYLEDAVGHEASILKILEESMNLIEDENLTEFLEKEVKMHTSLKECLMNLLEDESHEW